MRILYIIIGMLCFILGMIGTIIPILPTVPFLLVTVYCFAHSSKRLNTWFKETSLYQKHLANYVLNGSMTLESKVKIMVTLTILMFIGIILMGNRGIMVGCIVLGLIWFIHMIYFIFIVKTNRGNV